MGLFILGSKLSMLKLRQQVSS